MGQISLQSPTVGQPNSTEDPKITSDFNVIQTWANGNVDATNASAAFAQSAGVNQAGQTVKGAVSIAAAQSTGSTTYTTLATPDQVTGIVMPANGLIEVWYQATWFESVAGGASAAIFLNSNQLVAATVQNAVPQPTAASIASDAVPGTGTPLSSCALGLATLNIASSTPYGPDATTGQAVGVGQGTTESYGPCVIFAAAGTYAISVQFKASSGTVTAQNRKLWVRAISFT